MPSKPKRTVIWHAKPDPRRGWIRDFGLSCGHVLVHRVLPKAKKDRPSIPEKMACPCCAEHAKLVPVRMPMNGTRTPIGWRRQMEVENRLAAERLAAAPLSSPETSQVGGQVPTLPPRPSRPRPSQVWSPRDLAARNFD